MRLYSNNNIEQGFRGVKNEQICGLETTKHPTPQQHLLPLDAFTMAQLQSFRGLRLFLGFVVVLPFVLIPTLTSKIWSPKTSWDSGSSAGEHQRLSLLSSSQLKKYFANRAMKCAMTSTRYDRVRAHCDEAQIQDLNISMDFPLPIYQSLPDFADFGSFQYSFHYSQPATRGSVNLPEPKCYPEETMIVLILSARENFDQRAAIRETWGKGHSVYFAVGGPSVTELEEIESAKNSSQGLRASAAYKTDVQVSLEEEQATFQDLIDSVHPDSYQSLPHKMRHGFGWIVSNNPGVQWLVKADDDQMFRLHTLKHSFLRNFNPYTPMVIGNIFRYKPVYREGQWAEYIYPNERYPFFPQGGAGYVISRVVAEYVAFTPGLTYYQGEDTSVGIWLNQSELETTFICSRYFQEDMEVNCSRSRLDWLAIGHKFDIEKIRKCYEVADEWPDELAQDVYKQSWDISNFIPW